MTPKPSLSRPLQLATVALLALSLGGCIILPVGHRHHHGRHVGERAIVVVPADRHHDGHERHHRGRRY